MRLLNKNKLIPFARRIALLILEAVLIVVIVKLSLIFFKDKGELLVDSIRWIFR